LFFGQATFAVKMLLQELEVRLGAILGGEKLILRGWVEGGRLDVCSDS
jgi:hypothetical protein